MICTLLRAVELNEHISDTLMLYLTKQAPEQYSVLLSRVATACLELGTLAKEDLDNLEVYTAMAKVIDKMRWRL